MRQVPHVAFYYFDIYMKSTGFILYSVCLIRFYDEDEDFTVEDESQLINSETFSSSEDAYADSISDSEHDGFETETDTDVETESESETESEVQTVYGLYEVLIYSDQTYQTLYSGNESIKIEGSLPNNAVIKAFPADVDVEDETLLCAFDITIFLEDGSTYEPEEKLQVVIESSDFADENLNVYYFPENASPIEMNAVTNDEEVSFTTDHFSVYGVTLDDSDTTASNSLLLSAVSASDYVGTINTANQWQIVSGKYEGNDNSQKIGKDLNGDGITDLWIQKNVIPTGTENEFRVYLSETVQMTWEELLSTATLGLTTQGKWKETDVGSIVSSSEIGGNRTNALIPGNTGSGNQYTATIYLRSNGEIVNSFTQVYTGTTPNASNCTGYILLNGTLNGKAIIASTQVNLHNGSQGTGGSLEYTIDLDKMVSAGIVFATDPIELDTVTDKMGDYIIFGEVTISDGNTSTDSDQTILTWYPDEEVAQVTGQTVDVSGKTTGYQYNICQMVYTVKLDVTKDDFNSCADNMNNAVDQYAVNEFATLNYHYGTTYETMDFPQPMVRGLLYNIDFNKKDDSGEMLSGAKFKLYKIEDNQEVFIQEITTTEEITRFSNLEYGDYIIRETSAPDHYTMSETKEWQVRVCYTDSASDLEQYPNMTDNMRYKKNDTESGIWQIINNYKPVYYKVQILKTDDSDQTQPLSGATFKISDPDDDSAYITGTTNASGLIEYEGKYVENTAYKLTESSAPNGYTRLSSEMTFKVTVDKTDNYKVTAQVNGTDVTDMISYELIPIEGDKEENEPSYTLKITVKNRSGAELPETGGMGTLFFEAGGLIVLAIALIYGYMLKRRYGRG